MKKMKLMITSVITIGLLVVACSKSDETVDLSPDAVIESPLEVVDNPTKFIPGQYIVVLK